MWVFILTILAVSVDAYVAGLSLTRIGRRPALKVLYASAYTLIFSAVFTAAFAFISGTAAYILKIIGACILIILGVKNIGNGIAENRMPAMERAWSMSGLSLIGISIALDAAVASVTLTVPAALLWLVPVFMFSGHFLFLWAGSRTARLLPAMGVINRFSGGFLVVLGIFRLFQ